MEEGQPWPSIFRPLWRQPRNPLPQEPALAGEQGGEPSTKDNSLCLPNNNIFAWVKGESFTEAEFLASLDEEYNGTSGVSKLEITDTEVIYKKNGVNLYSSFKKREGYSNFVFDSTKEITWGIVRNDITTVTANQRKIEVGIKIGQPDGLDISPLISCLKSLGSINNFTNLYGTTNSSIDGYTMSATINDANNNFTLPLTCFIRIDSNISSLLTGSYFFKSKSFSVQ